MPVRLVDTTRQYQSLKEEIDAAIGRVLEHGRYILGPEVAALESEMAEACGCTAGIAVASGTDALLLSLASLGVGPGDEVITTPFTFVSTAEVISLRGAQPIFADIDPITFNLDPAAIESRITPRTVGIVPVHLYGQIADMDGILALARRHGLWVMEDAAQAIGATRNGQKAGSFGSMAGVSFFPTKNLGAFGDGGMIVTSDSDLADRARRYRYHGSTGGYEYDFVGYNSRLDELQAAILRAKLPHLQQFNEARRVHADYYRAHVVSSYIQLPEDLSDGGHVYHQFTVRSQHRDTLARWLKASGVESKVYYPAPLHLQRTYGGLGYKVGDLPIAEQAASEVLSLPVSPEMTRDEIEQVTQALNNFKPGD